MSNPPIEIDYNPAFQSLTNVLASVERPGDFFVTGKTEAPMPRITTKGADPLSFPVPKSQARKWIRLAERAPYGRGEETIVDRKVRDVWQIQPGKIRISGKTWNDTLDGIVAHCARDLGCLDTPVTAEFYKLLIYEPGSFFLTHRDTEKSSGMFATLVLSMPSTHTGGDLLVRQEGRETALQLLTEEPSEITYAAFFADCEHEVKPIESGHRLCLVYNLIQTTKKGKSVAKSTLKSPNYQNETEQVARLVKEWFESPRATSKIVYLLDHQYTPEGLYFAGLKNGDAALAKVLSEAASQSGMAVHLAIVHIWETGAAEAYYQPNYGRNWGYHDEYDEEESDDCDFEIVEACDWGKSLSAFKNTSNQSVDFGTLPLDDAELLPFEALKNEPPDSQRVTEATGNEGASYERSYHRAALVLWPQEKFSEILLEAGAPAALPYLNERIEHWLHRESGSRRGKAWKELNDLADRILGKWILQPAYGADSRPEHRRELLNLLVQMGSIPLLERAIKQVTLRSFDGAESTELVKAAAALGPAKTAAQLKAVLSRRFPDQPRACLEWFAALTDEVSFPAWKRTLHELAETVVDSLGKVRLPAPPQSYYSYSRRRLYSPKPDPHPVDAEFIERLVAALEKSGGSSLVESGIEKLRSKPKIYPPESILTPAVEELLSEKSSVRPASARALWGAAAGAIAKKTAKIPRPPKNWARKAKLKCRCRFCDEINRFAQNTDQKELRIAAKTSDRKHIHNSIESANLEMTHETERKGSPYTLVITKTLREYERKLDQFKESIHAAERLISIAPRGEKKQESELERNVSHGRDQM